MMLFIDAPAVEISAFGPMHIVLIAAGLVVAIVAVVLIRRVIKKRK